jgi:hypothetical protein
MNTKKEILRKTQRNMRKERKWKSKRKGRKMPYYFIKALNVSRLLRQYNLVYFRFILILYHV